MAHFALLDENNIVTRVEVVHNDCAPDEATGVAFLQSLYSGGNFKQTSYNATIRKNFAGIGFTFDSGRDAFIAPQPYPSWILDEGTCRWNAPTTMPTDGKMYSWDEPTLAWVEMVAP